VSVNVVSSKQSQKGRPFKHTVRVTKNDADTLNAFPKCVCGAAPAANWKASSGNRRFLPKSAGLEHT